MKPVALLSYLGFAREGFQMGPQFPCACVCPCARSHRDVALDLESSCRRKTLAFFRSPGDNCSNVSKVNLKYVTLTSEETMCSGQVRSRTSS